MQLQRDARAHAHECFSLERDGYSLVCRSLFYPHVHARNCFAVQVFRACDANELKGKIILGSGFEVCGHQYAQRCG